MKVTAMQRAFGKAQASSAVRDIPVTGAVYPFFGPKQPITYGPKVVQSIADFRASLKGA